MSAFAAFMSNMRCLTSLPIPVCAASLLLIEYVASTAAGHDVDNAMIRKEKSSLPLPFCCWRYRPTKAYFMYTVKVRREFDGRAVDCGVDTGPVVRAAIRHPATR